MARTSIAQALAEAQIKHEMMMQEPGLEAAPVQKGLEALLQAGEGYGVGQMGGMIANALATKGVPALQGLGEAGYARIPKGPEEPFKLPEGWVKGDLYTPSERAYKVNELNEQMYLHNYDFQNALKAKWAMLRHAGGN